jgi:hypothetical protein
MKRMITMGITLAALVLLGAGTASSQSSGQSLGDAARAARKKKAQSEPATHQYDNDNLPRNETLSVVGPEPSAATSDQQASSQQTAQQEAQAKVAATEQRQQAADDMQKKLDAQKAKIDELARELDLDQREYRLRAAAMYSDAGNRLRNEAQWDKDDAHYKTELESKQKALDEAKAQLADLQEQARKAGVKEKESDGTAKDSDNQDRDNKDK